MKDVLGETTILGDSRLRTMVLLVAKNATLGSNWFFINNPRNKFFTTNAHIPLWHIVRASSAAPTYFPPHCFSIPDASGTAHRYEFIDGGVSAYNNPSLQVFLEATVPQYGIGWPTGVDNLLLISLGTGFCPATIEAGKAAHYHLLNWARYALGELLNDANLQQNVLMHLIGATPAPDPSTLGEATACGTPSGTPSDAVLAEVSEGLGSRKLLTYQRITVGLTRERLDRLKLPEIDPVAVREMDAVDQIANMRCLGEAVAHEQVHMERLIRFFTN